MKRILRSAKVDFVRRKSVHAHPKNNTSSQKLDQQFDHQSIKNQVSP